MVNVMVNDVCNLNCSYCFVREFADERRKKGKAKNMQMTDFKEVVNFITKTHNRIGLIGGEPTLHPKIEEIIKCSLNNKKIERVNLFTNAIYLEKVIDYFENPKMGALINLNSPEEVGEETYNKILKNIDKLYFEKGVTNFTLGINMYKENFPYDYIIDALKRYNKQKVRVAIVAPNSKKMRENNYLDYCEKIKESVLKFFKDLYEIKVVPVYDCSGNVIPPCLYTEDEKNFLKKIVDLDKKNEKIDSSKKLKTNVLDFSSCRPVTEITTDKEVVRCLPLAKEERRKLSDFKIIEEAYDYYRREYDVFVKKALTDPRCKNCENMSNGECQGGCIAYSAKEIKKIRSKK